MGNKDNMNNMGMMNGINGINGMNGIDEKEMKKKEWRMNIIMAIAMSICMGVTFTFITRNNADPKALENMQPAPIAYLISILESVTVGVIVALIIPIGRMGKALSRKCNAYPPSIKFSLINCIPFALINAIFVSAICSFIGIATSYSKNMDPHKPTLMKMWFDNWISILWLSILVGYVLAIIIAPFVRKAVGLGGAPTGGPPADNS